MTEVLKVHWQQKGNNDTKKEKDTRHHKHHDNHDWNNYQSSNVLVSSVIVHLFIKSQGRRPNIAFGGKKSNQHSHRRIIISNHPKLIILFYFFIARPFPWSWRSLLSQGHTHVHLFLSRYQCRSHSITLFRCRTPCRSGCPRPPFNIWLYRLTAE